MSIKFPRKKCYLFLIRKGNRWYSVTFCVSKKWFSDAFTSKNCSDQGLDIRTEIHFNQGKNSFNFAFHICRNGCLPAKKSHIFTSFTQWKWSLLPMLPISQEYQLITVFILHIKVSNYIFFSRILPKNLHCHLCCFLGNYLENREPVK